MSLFSFDNDGYITEEELSEAISWWLRRCRLCEEVDFLENRGGMVY